MTGLFMGWTPTPTPTPSALGDDSDFLPRMNLHLPTNPPNHSDCGESPLPPMNNLPPNQPNYIEFEFGLPNVSRVHSSPLCLRYSGGPCCTHDGWSRDQTWRPDSHDDWLHFNETTNSGDEGHSLANLGRAVAVPQLGFPNNNIYDGRLPGERSHLLESENWHHDLELENLKTSTIGERGDAEVEVQDAPHQLVYQTNINDFVDGTFEGIDSPDIATTSRLHHQVESDGEHVCQECSLQFPHISALDNHAKQTQHRPYTCNCGGTFSRFDVLGRHLQKFNPKEVYPCSYCSKFSGQRAFTRPDHLTQHLRGYHHIESSTKSLDLALLDSSASKSKTRFLFCPHEGCVYHHDDTSREQPPSFNTQNVRRFRTQKEFTKHLREVHDESSYPCDAPGCDRTGGRGFFRKRALVMHQKGHRKDSHPVAA